MAWGRRCDLGCQSWPDDDHYKVCPGCGQKTQRFHNLEPLTESEARHAEFEAFYERWDEDHDASRLDPDGPNAAGKYADSVRRVEALSFTRKGTAA